MRAKNFRQVVLASNFLLALWLSVQVSTVSANSDKPSLPPGFQHVCAPPGKPGVGHCHSVVRPQASIAPIGLSPATVKSVYSFSTSTSAGAGKTIAIVDSYDDPTAESDLGIFSSQYELPSCTTANGCFRKVNQTGGTGYPQSNSSWALEISLDVQWAHAIAPGAQILLVEANSNLTSDLYAAEDYAKTHAQYISNSWGGSESIGESSLDSHFTQSGVSFFASAGDAGLPAEYPSSSPYVISVGGTTLNFSNGVFSSETGWSSGGGGCSAYENANSVQAIFSQYSQVNCGGKRATPDVALDADPNSGVAVYDGTSYSNQTGWFTVGGTSASAPMWAARSADAGVIVNAAYVYGSNITFRDITSGNNGASCLVGFDLCTGRGSWMGSNPIPTTAATNTPTATYTNTPVPATSMPTATYTNTPIPPTNTPTVQPPTNTPAGPTATPSTTTVFSTGLESGQTQPTWTNTVEPSNGGINNVGGICCGLSGPELGVRTNENTHTGSVSLMYSGMDNSATSSYAYMEVFSVNIPVVSTTKLSYWIFPQSTATNSLVSGSNSACVAIDMVFTDGSNLRDTGVTDQHDNRLHPAYQCGHLTMDNWNNVLANLGPLAGKTIARINVAYDQPGNTGGYRGYVDDISITQ